MFSRFARRFVSTVIPSCYAAALVSTQFDNITLSDNEVDDVVNKVRNTYNSHQVARKAAEMIEGRYQEDFILQQFLVSLLDGYEGEKNGELTLLDIGCGSATTMAKMMEFVVFKPEYKQRFDSAKIIGIDIASNMLRLSRKNLSITMDWISHNYENASNDDIFNVKYDLIEGDMRYLTDIFDDNNDKFNGIICFYSIFHVPRQEHSNIIEQMNQLLKDDGVLCICLGAKDMSLLHGPMLFEDEEMYWSHYDVKENLKLIEKSNFQIVDHIVIDDQLSKNTQYLFVVAKKK